MSWWHYLLLVNFYLLLFFAFYALLLRRETFFQLNRVYLVAAALLSFAIPVIQADWVKNLFITKQVQHTLYGNGAELIVYNFSQVEHSVTIGNILTCIYIGVTLFLTLRLLWQLIVLKKQIEKPSPSAAYSFFKKISLGRNVAEHHVIARHEQVHVRQWHSVDVMIIETVMIINWFNPVVYLYRFAIKYIHEYIADMQVISAGTDKADYAMLLLSQTFQVPAHHLTNPFYSSSMLKKRIAMLQKSRSQRIMLFKYCLSAPLFVLMMILSSATVNNSDAVNSINNGVRVVMQAPVENIIGELDHAEIPALIDQVKFPPPVAITDGVVDPHYPEQLNKDFKTEDLFTADNKVFLSVEQNPEFPGGLTALGKYLSENIMYPKQSHDDNIQGKVHVNFIVEEDGSLSDIKALTFPSADLKAEAIRVISNSPKWQPGIQNGKPVRVQLTVPINFSLSDSEPPMNDADFFNKSGAVTAIERAPEFPGGFNAFGRFLKRNLRYPEEMKNLGLQGIVFVNFVVDKDGTLSDVKATRGPSEEFNNEAVRVIASSPKWKPGIQNGQVTKVQYNLPIHFTMTYDDATSQQGGIDDMQMGYVQNANNGKIAAAAKLNGKPLVIVDGSIYTKGIASIKSKSVSQVDVIKGEVASLVYGDRAKDGAILISTKRK